MNEPDDCICEGATSPAHLKECPVRKRHPRVDLGDVDVELVQIGFRCGFGVAPDSPELRALRYAFRSGFERGWMSNRAKKG